MADKVNANKIAEQFGQFMESKRSTKKANKDFANELLNKIAPKEYGKPKLAEIVENRQRISGPPPKLSAKSRKITDKQAQRLASYAPFIERAAARHNVPVELICGVILQESGAQRKAVSHCGAKGLMQLMPGTAKRFGVKDSFNAGQNIDGGTKYLRWLLDRFDGKVELALAGYNAGEHNVEKYGNKIPPFRETRNYVPGVLSYTQTMIDIFAKKRFASNVPQHARRV